MADIFRSVYLFPPSMPRPVKPPRLKTGSKVRIVAPGSPVEEARLKDGLQELARLGYLARTSSNVLSRDGYFAGNTDTRRGELEVALASVDEAAVFCARGGYGSNYLLDGLRPSGFRFPKVLLGYSDITTVQIFLWEKLGWVTFYGPMVAAGLDGGANGSAGYDLRSFQCALTETESSWSLSLEGEVLVGGQAEGVLLGGCLTLIETSIGTPWELDTKGAILLLEDRGMRPYQVDRALVHLKQAGKLRDVRGFVLGEFPECDPPAESNVTVLDALRRLLPEAGVPVVWRAPIGHTPRPMLTVPLGIPVRLDASGPGRLEVLEPAVVS
ncbi:MAG TPA: LD-carboxypeptidase [Candidatus Acidoferrales bacterium]|nr:LD-carboxypeptidase [Candidatus Acidoferrales bacterium]